MPLSLATPVSELTSVGKALTKRLKTLGLETVEDLLWYVPLRYDDFRQVGPIAQLQPDTQATVHGRLTMINNRRSWRSHKMVTEAIVEDATGSVRVVWFNQPYLTRTLAAGDEVSIAGRVRLDAIGMQFVGPQYEKIKPDIHTASVHTGRLVPVYPVTAGVTPKQIRFLVAQSLPVVEQIGDWLPEALRAHHHLLPLPEALREMHFPGNTSSLARARMRIGFEELFPVQYMVLLMKKKHASQEAPALLFHQDAIKQFVDALPYALTTDQKKVAWQIMQDMGQTRPMRRLVQGDVGSGKTVVAALAAWHALCNQKRVLYMAPTEVLAHQQYTTLTRLFSSFSAVRIARLTSAETKKGTLKKAIAAGEYNLIVGTHALIQEDVKVPDLALVIVDEQHRFGVRQRQEISQRGIDGNRAPHFLSMTATPIPRTYALVLYGDLDISVIRTKPAGRKPIITRLVTVRNRDQAYAFMRKQVLAGRQAFVICPLIDENDLLGVKSVAQEYERLRTEVFPEFPIAMLHGKMKPKEKNEIMEQFLAGTYAVLVSTSVIEVGIDVPNATIMLIEGAQRFGLAQLHQFRGRVGRGSEQSYCFVSAEDASKQARERLEFFATCDDGFALAEYDLEQRGAGELYGTVQSGYFSFQIASLADTPLIESTARIASALVSQGAGPEILKKIHFAKRSRGVHLE